MGLGSVAVASFDAFARVRDASEDAAREVLTEGSAVASDIIALRYVPTIWSPIWSLSKNLVSKILFLFLP